MNITIEEKILIFLENQSNLKLNKAAVLFRDLKLIGDDADIFLERFAEEFKVDFSDFEFEKYFLEEGIIFQYWYLKLFKPEKLKRKEFDLSHLVKVVERGKWFDA